MSRVRTLAARTPLRVRLVVVLVLLVAVALAAAGLASTAVLRGYLLDRVDSQLTGVAQSFADHPVSGSRPPGGGGPGDQGAPPSEFYVQYADASGTPLSVVSNPLTAGSQPELPRWTLDQVVTRNGAPFTVPDSAGGTSWRAVALPVGGASATVTVAQSLTEVEATVGQLRAVELVVGAVVLLVLALVSYWLVRRSLRPLRTVEQTAGVIAAGDLSQRVPEADPRTEVGSLARSFNGMVDRIETAFSAQAASEASARASEQRMRQFVADASHELRTPLTSIRGFADLYQQGGLHDPAGVDRAMSRIGGEASRMGLLVDDLLLLARLDQQRPLAARPVDLLELVTDAVHDAQATHPGRTVTLEVTAGADPPVVTGDEARLRQVVANLMSNALRHTPAEAAVCVRLRTEPDPPTAVLEVADQGPGMSPEAASRVFERFFRTDDARSRDDGGTGLGLAIVASIVHAHGGQVELDTAPGQGATFRVRLPRG
jgi:two-component system OmpR family sensor kinase